MAGCIVSFKTPSVQTYWPQREAGTECKERCVKAAAYTGGYCTTLASFLATVGCATFNISNPLGCSLLEGPFWGLAAYCSSDVFESFCEKCREGYTFADLLHQQLTLDGQIKDAIIKMTAIKQKLQVESKHIKDSVGQTVDMVKNQPLLHGRYDRTMSRIRYVTTMFHRIKLSDEDGAPVNDRLLQRYLYTSLDSGTQTGLLTLLHLFQGLLVGKSLTIYGPRGPSLFQLDKSFCGPTQLDSIDKTMFSLIHQMNFAHMLDKETSKSDLKALNAWVTQLRTELVEHIKLVCSTAKIDSAMNEV